MDTPSIGLTNLTETKRRRIVKRLPFLRSLAGVALLCTAAFVLWAAIGAAQTQGAISFGEIFVVNSTGDGDDVFPD